MENPNCKKCEFWPFNVENENNYNPFMIKYNDGFLQRLKDEPILDGCCLWDDKNTMCPKWKPKRSWWQKLFKGECNGRYFKS